MDAATRRAVLVALNAHQQLSREAICRLALAVDAWAAGPPPAAAAWAAAIRVSPRALGTAIELAPRAPEIASGLLADAAARGLRVIVAGDEDYPRALRELELPPPVLYCRGRLPARPAIAIVGSRAADPYGLEATAHFAYPLARAGLTVVSGFARGIDTAAHRAALRDPGGTTVAVLGCGLDVDYPRGSARLRRDIERQGALISEFAIGMPALPENFPIRNRIIAALGCACLVIQAAPRSGSLSTARQALDAGARRVGAAGADLRSPLDRNQPSDSRRREPRPRSPARARLAAAGGQGRARSDRRAAGGRGARRGSGRRRRREGTGTARRARCSTCSRSAIPPPSRSWRAARDRPSIACWRRCSTSRSRAGSGASPARATSGERRWPAYNPRDERVGPSQSSPAPPRPPGDD